MLIVLNLYPLRAQRPRKTSPRSRTACMSSATATGCCRTATRPAPRQRPGGRSSTTWALLHPSGSLEGDLQAPRRRRRRRLKLVRIVDLDMQEKNKEGGGGRQRALKDPPTTSTASEISRPPTVARRRARGDAIARRQLGPWFEAGVAKRLGDRRGRCRYRSAAGRSQAATAAMRSGERWPSRTIARADASADQTRPASPRVATEASSSAGAAGKRTLAAALTLVRKVKA